MIRVFLSKRFLASLASLSGDQRQKAEKVLRDTMKGFGDPHRHAGLGFRKLTPDYYECRLDLRLRILFRSRQEGLIAYDILTHDQIRALLKKG